MKFNRDLLLKATFIISIVTIIGALMKIEHLGYSEPFLIIGLITTAIYVSIALYEIITSNRIRGIKKLILTIGFLSGFAPLVGFIYIFFGRKKVVQS